MTLVFPLANASVLEAFAAREQHEKKIIIARRLFCHNTPSDANLNYKPVKYRFQCLMSSRSEFAAVIYTRVIKL